MRARKRARHSRNTTATASPSASPSPSGVPSKSSPPPTAVEHGFNDRWTDAEESALFRGLLRIKPTGMHKHANMMTLHSWLAENHHIHPANEHTRIPGIWAKLATLYDLAALDAREDARQLDMIPGLEEEGVVLDGEWSEVDNLVEVGEFGLPVSEDEGVKREVWGRRLRGKQDDGEDSDAEMPELNLRNTPPRVLDLRTGVEPTPQGKSGKGKEKGKDRARTGKDVDSRRGGLVPSRRSARRAESTADDASMDDRQEEGQDEAEGEEGEEEEEDGEGEESEDKESRASTPAMRSTRSKGDAAAKGGTRVKGRARAKPK